MEQKKSVKQVKKRRKKKKKEFGKIALLLIIFNCAIVEAYSMVAMWYFDELAMQAQPEDPTAVG